MTTVIQETDAVQTAQPCETDNLINVPVDYVSVKLNQSRNIKQLRGAARETQETLVRQTWKRKARNLNFSTPISSAVSVAMGSKRTYKETVSDKDEWWRDAARVSNVAELWETTMMAIIF